MVHIALFGSIFAPKIEKNLVLGVTGNLSPKKSKKFPFVSEFDETFWVTIFRDTNLTAQSVSLSEI